MWPLPSSSQSTGEVDTHSGSLGNHVVHPVAEESPGCYSEQ